MIEVKNLIFEYPGNRALKDINLAIPEKSITALVGPNGAGKTTLLRCIAGLLTPLAGSVTIMDIDVLSDPRTAHEHIGYLPDFFGLYGDLTVEQALTYAAMAHKIKKEILQETVLKAATRLQIDDRLQQKAATLSRGLSQRLAIAQACVHEPKVLLLDEPASGLDPEARQELSRLFLQLQDQGITIIVSSHILAELEEYSGSMIMVKNGEVIGHKDLCRPADNEIGIRVLLTQTVEGCENILASISGIRDFEINDKQLYFKTDKNDVIENNILSQLMSHGLPVCSFSEDKINMQDVYLQKISF